MMRPDETGVYGAPLALSPGWCTLSILFSDWDRSGRRDLRMTNDRHYYRDGEEQLWRIAQGEPPRLYTAADGWQKMSIWGMGIASYDLTGDGLPEVYPHQSGRQQAADPGRRGIRAQLRRHRTRYAVSMPTDPSPARTPCFPPPPGTPSSRT